MSNKIGRNAKCPCASGRKFKHCCFNKSLTDHKIKQSRPKKENNILSKFFKSFHNTDLVATLASLTIYPPNHGKNLRLEYLVFQALSTRNKSEDLVDPDRLKLFLCKHYESHHLEDPPSNLFTENILYTLGNNTVYGGNYEQGAYTLNTLISAIQFNQNLYPKEFIQKTNGTYILILTISDTIASRLGHERNLYGDQEKYGTEIQVPRNISEYKNALFFTNEWINNFCKNFRIIENVISPLCLDIEKIKNNNIEIADNNNPLITKPLAELSNGILVVSPTTILTALIHYTWLLSDKYDCKNILLKEYHKIVRNELVFYSNKIKWKPNIFEFKKNETLPIDNALFKFDKDKFVYLSIIYDEGHNYNRRTPCQVDPLNQMEKIQKLQKENLKLLQHKFKGQKFIEVILYSSIGREYLLMFSQGENCYTYISSVYKFLCWIKSESHDNMSLWYFLDSKEKFLNSFKHIIPNIGFLNYYDLYRKNNSFYISDEK